MKSGACSRVEQKVYSKVGVVQHLMLSNKRLYHIYTVQLNKIKMS